MSRGNFYTRDLDDYNHDQIEVPEEDHALFDLMYGIKELLRARPNYREAEYQYEGKIQVDIADPRLNKMLQSQADRHRFNLASVPVKVLSHHVRLAGMKMENEGAQKRWDQIWKANDLDGWAPQIHTNTFTRGDHYVMVWPSETEADQTADTGDTTQGEGEFETSDDDVLVSGVDFFFFSPLNTRMIYDKNNPRISLYTIRMWQENGYMLADLYYRDTIQHFITVSKNARGVKMEDWVPYAPSYTIVVGNQIETVLDEPVVENPFGEIPIKHFSTGLPYGTPVHKDGYGAANAISELLIAQIATITAQGWPAQIALEDPEATIENNTDTPNWDDDDDPLDQGDRALQGSQLRSGPGTITVLQGIKDVLQLMPADPSVFTEPVELYLSILSTLTETPLYSFKPGGEQPSGKAREIADGPRKAREAHMKILLGNKWRETATLALKMVGVTDPGDIEPNWAPSTMITELDDWTKFGLMLKSGVPFEQVMQEAGYDSETVTSWLESMPEMAIEEQAEITKQIAEVMTALGSGIKSYIISEQDANLIFAGLMEKLGVTISEAPEKPDPMDVLGGIQDGDPGASLAIGDVRAQLGRPNQPAGGGAVANPGRTSNQGKRKQPGKGSGTAGPRRS